MLNRKYFIFKNIDVYHTALYVVLLIVLLVVLLLHNDVFAKEIFENRHSSLLPIDAQWALIAADLKTGKIIVRMGPAERKLLAPGSLLKMITAGAVFDQLMVSEKTHFATTILATEVNNGKVAFDLYLVGTGNALLSYGDLKNAVQKMIKDGITEVTGDVYADDSLLDATRVEVFRDGPGYGRAGALGLDLHTVEVIAIPTEQGKPPRVIVEPPNDAVRIAIEARTSTIHENIATVQIDDTSYKVTGNITPATGVRKWRFSLRDPAWYAAGVLKTELLKAGVKVRGEIKKGKVPPHAKGLVTIQGPTMKKMLQDMNVNSLNVVADNLFLLLGAERYGEPGTLEKGLATEKEFLGGLGLAIDGATIMDGSGLNPKNRLIAGFMTSYLQKVAYKKWRDDFIQSLPRAGLDGTAKGIQYKNEKFRVKTGRLENAYALAGYGTDSQGREIAFTYIVNCPLGFRADIEQSGAEVIRYLAEHSQLQ